MFAASKSGSVEDKDAQFNYVTMLLHGDGTNGSQNNTFLDVGAVFTASVTLTTMTVSAITSGTILIGHTISGSGVSSATISAQLTGTTGGTGTYTVSVSQTVTSGTISSSFAITRNGNTTQGTFTPYGSNWSNYFDGTGDYLELASNSAFNMNTYCCLEAFVNYTTIGTSTLIVGRDSSYQLGYNFTAIGGTANKFVFTIYNGSSWQAVSSTTTPVAGVWYHVVGIKDNTTLRIYINGTQENTATFSGTAVTTSNVMGVGANQNTQNMAGYISNTRLVLGASSAVLPYTGNFTSPTTPLTAVSGTALLTCADNRFIDDSSNAFAITKYGDTSVQRFSPFSPTTAYSTSVIGGSGYFDGSGDYLTAPQSAAFNIGTGQFTVECFIYWNGTALANGGYGLINLGNGANGGGPFTGWGLILDFDSGGKPTFYRFDGTVYSYQSSTNPTANQWIHLAVSRNSSNTLSIWMNGIRVYTGTVTTSFNNVNSDPLNIGYRQDGGTGGTHYFPGYISNARVVVGTDVYGAANSTITVPTAPLTAITNTSLLLSYTNAGILDNAMMNDLETVGNAQISTSVKKYGTGSIFLDGTGDYLSVPSNPNLGFGSGNFTVEAWLYLTSAPTGADAMYVCDFRNGSTNNFGFGVISSSGTKLYMFVGSGPVEATGSTSLSLNTWYHIAMVRSGSTVTYYLNGVSDATMTTSFSQGTTGVTVGARYTGSTEYVAGYIDDLRITKGLARYTATFTPPIVAFADKG